MLHHHFIEAVPALVAVHPVAHHLASRVLDRLKREHRPRVAFQRTPRFGELDDRWVAIHKVWLTPELAQCWLDRLHPINSGGWRDASIDAYAALMLAGTWEGLSSVVFTSGGYLLDGKHRCAAVIRSGKPIWVLRATALVDESGLW